MSKFRGVGTHQELVAGIAAKWARKDLWPGLDGDRLLTVAGGCEVEVA